MADADKELKLTLRTVADLTGAEATNQAMQKTASTADEATQAIREEAEAMQILKQAMQEQLAASGLNEQQTAKATEAFDAMLHKLEDVQQKVAEGIFTEDEGAHEYGIALEKVTTDLEQLREVQDKAEKDNERYNRTIDQTAKAYAKVGHREQMEGLGGVARQSQAAGNGMRITAERAVQMGQAIAGLTSMVIAGADAKQLMAAGATNLAMILSTGGPLGVAAGVIVQLFSTLTLQLSKAHEQAKKAAEEGFKDLARELDATAKAMSDLDFDDATRQLERHRAAVRKLAEEWEDSRKKEEAYFNSLAEKTDAQLERDKAVNERKRQEELSKATTDEEKDEINRRYDGNERDIDHKGKMEANERERQELETRKQNAQKEIDELQRNLEDLRGQAEKAGNAGQIKPEGVVSDQQRSLDRYNEALRNQAAGKGTDADLEIIRQIGPMLDEIRKAIAEGRETYDQAKKEGKPGDAAAIEGAEKAAKAQADALATLLKEIEEMQKRLDEAYQREKDVDGDLENNRNRREAIGARGVAGDLEAQREAREAEAKRKQDAEKDQQREDKKSQGEDKKKLKGAEGAAKKADAELDKTAGELEGKLSEMADKVRDTNAALASKFDALGEMLKDGTNAEEIMKIAEFVKQYTDTSNASFNSLATSVMNLTQSSQGILKRMESLAAEVEKLKARVKP